MHRILSLLLALAMLLTSIGPALAKSDFGASTAGGDSQLSATPMDGAESVRAEPVQPDMPAPEVANSPYLSAPAQTDKVKDKDKGNCQDDGDGNEKKCNKPKTEDRKNAAARSFQAGALNPLMMVEPQAEVAQRVEVQAAAAAATLINGAPHYFSHPNYANSPLPTVTGSVINVGNDLTVDRPNSSDLTAQVFVILPTPLPDGMIQSFQVRNQPAAGGAPASAGGKFHAYVLRPTGTQDVYDVIFDSGQLTMPPLADENVSEISTFPVANLAVQADDLLAFYGQGVPLTVGAAGDMAFSAPFGGPLQNSTIEVNGTVFPSLNENRTYSFAAGVLDLGTISITGGMKKFVDGLPGLGVGTANNLGQYIPVGIPDTTTYTIANGYSLDADYYEIALIEYTEQLHSDLPPTTLRGYVQLATNVVPGDGVPLTDPDNNPILLPNGNQAIAVAAPHYMSTAIVAEQDRPVRIKFYNLLPTGADGNLFLPVDSTVMGSGTTPEGHMADMTEVAPWDDPLNPPCSGPTKDTLVAQGLCFADNRAIIHLHGGISPWISDGTPHQWITPAGETTTYPQGVSVRPVPDMVDDTGDATDGVMTFYYTNQQSARLMFYHDHAWGITRLNVYAGMAAPYIIQDETEQALVDSGLIPGPDDTIPLVIQDKTFVPDDAQLALQDETWDTARWGGEGNLWAPHVYSPAQNPGDAEGVNQFGRWAYGPWFWPPTKSIDHGPVANPYYDANCDPDQTWCEPPLMPGTPYNSMGMESFNDTPVINGTAYPTLTVDPKAYRFRILNAANDRFFNLSLYQAIDANGVLCDANNPNPAAESTDIACTEVFLNPDEVAAALDDPAGVFPTPVAGTEGPDWIAIASEGGFLPTPAVIPAQFTTWVTDPTVFNAGNVDQHSLLTAPAERHDVIVDFSQFAGQTLILYNDAPAAFPARDPRYDYYTGNPDLRDIGGTASTLPGYGPNVRTIMQIKVSATTPAPAFDLASLTNAFAHQQDGSGVFESGQNPIIVGQGAYNSAYGTAFKINGPKNGTVQIFDNSFTFETLLGNDLTFGLEPKMIQDEMGEAFGLEYGRMSGFLGVETPNAQAGSQNMILHGYTYPPDEVLDGVELPPGAEVTPIATNDDGTQIWKITHNGVDTHPIHFHLYDIQLINRVGWDGIVRKPEANELGWKDTVRVSPLEDTIVAIRPIIPHLPEDWNGLPNSVRLLDPSMPEGVYLEGANTTLRESLNLPIWAFNPDGEPVDIVNHTVNFGWEYVFHCHILSHEEMDMMHPQVVGIAPPGPTFISAVRSGSGASQQYLITWNDNSKNETAFVIERRIAGSTDNWSWVVEIPSDPLIVAPGMGERTYVDPIGDTALQFEYQVYAINVVGDTWDYADPAFNNIVEGGWPTLTLDSRNEILTGTFTMQGRTNYGVLLSVKLYLVGASTPSYIFTPTSTSTGEFTLTGLAPGTYEVAVKYDNTLQNVRTVTILKGSNTADFGELRAGDANNDNEVTAVDFSILATTYNKVSTDPGFDGRADFNGDTEVTAVDFSLLISNYNQGGEQPSGVP